jgi:TP901 family phage tail tape measure protein
VDILSKRQKELTKIIGEQERKGVNANTTTIRYARAELDEVEKQISALNRKKTAINESTAALKTFLDRLKKSGLELGASILALKNIFGSSVNVSSDFETQMARIGAVSRYSGEELVVLGDAAKKATLGARYGAVEAAKALELFAKDGQSAAASAAALPDVMNLASAGLMSVEEAATMATQVFSGFGLKAGDMARVGDILIATSKTSSNTVAELGSALNDVSPAAKNAGMSLTETAAMIGKLSDINLSGAKASGALNAVIAGLSSPSRTGIKYLEQLGVSAKDAFGNYRPMIDVLAELDTRLTGFGDADKADIMGKIFGKGNIAAAQMLTREAGRGNLRQYAHDIERAGAASEAAKKQNETFASATKSLGNAMGSLGIEIGNVLLPGRSAKARIKRVMPSTALGLYK